MAKKKKFKPGKTLYVLYFDYSDDVPADTFTNKKTALEFWGDDIKNGSVVLATYDLRV